MTAIRALTAACLAIGVACLATMFSLVATEPFGLSDAAMSTAVGIFLPVWTLALAYPAWRCLSDLFDG